MVERVSKRFKEAQVLKEVSLKIEEGKICGLVGRNGSGKTMLMKCICGFVHPTEGVITVQGENHRKRRGICTEYRIYHRKAGISSSV